MDPRGVESAALVELIRYHLVLSVDEEVVDCNLAQMSAGIEQVMTAPPVAAQPRCTGKRARRATPGCQAN
ncbi:MAG: hypothetical protein ACRD0Z_02395 [Acidimicrobiales bacterium]